MHDILISILAALGLILVVAALALALALALAWPRPPFHTKPSRSVDLKLNKIT